MVQGGIEEQEKRMVLFLFNEGPGLVHGPFQVVDIQGLVPQLFHVGHVNPVRVIKTIGSDNGLVHLMVVFHFCIHGRIVGIISLGIGLKAIGRPVGHRENIVFHDMGFAHETCCIAVVLSGSCPGEVRSVVSSQLFSVRVGVPRGNFARYSSPWHLPENLPVSMEYRDGEQTVTG
jgi:hypothetical protein